MFRLIERHWGLPLPFDAYTDVESVISNFKELDKQYPDAAFILTTRNQKDWISSRSRHVIRNRVENSRGGSHSWIEIDVEAWIEERERHHEDVKKYFSGRKKKLLVLDLCNGDGWEELCSFLRLPVPDAAFPNVDPLIKLQALSRSLINRIPIASRQSIALDHDDHPWIKRPESIPNYTGSLEEIRGFGTRSGSFSPEITDNFDSVSSAHWNLLDNSFPYNLVQFDPQNVRLVNGGGIKLLLDDMNQDSTDLVSGALRSNRRFQFGRFEVEMRPVKASGVISAFFLYRIDPWQEIDIEFLGNDTSKMLINVYFNPGEEGTAQNHGTAGTPVVIDLGFDASIEFHHYAIEWDPNEIRWFVDDDLVHVRTTGYPTPIPNLSLGVYMNLWVPGNAKLAGKFERAALPNATEIKSIIISSWIKSELIDFRGEVIAG